MNLGNIITKAIGAGAVFLSFSDAHKVGLAYKNKAPQSYIAKTYPDIYINSQQMEAGALPTVVSNLKRSWFNVCLDDTIMPAIKSVKGYISGSTKQIINNVIPLSLGIGALALKGRRGNLCAGLLGLGALKIFIYDICNIGKYKKI